MSFSTPSGTYGKGLPLPAPLMRIVNRFAARRVRATGGRGFSRGLDSLVLTTIGAKSGEERAVPLNWFPSDDGAWLVVASSGASARNPAWYHNLAAHPDRVRIDVDRQRIDVTAEQLHGEERARAWESIVAASPMYRDYAAATDREIPVIRLARRLDGAS